MVTQTEEQHGQGVPLRLVECGQEIAAAQTANLNFGSAGTVTAVNVAAGDKSASGSGKLSLGSGSGHWSGKSGSASCSGTWTAQRS